MLDLRISRWVLLGAIALSGTAWCQERGVIWLEAETYRKPTGDVFLIDETTSDYGPMAQAEASGQAFVRFAPGARLPLTPIKVERPGEWVVWVRAFPLAGRLATVAINGQDVGSTAGNSTSIALMWHRLGTVRLRAGDNTVELRAAQGNTSLTYVDVLALLADPRALPIGATPRDIVTGPGVSRIEEQFSAATVEELSQHWSIRPPPGADAVVEMASAEDDGSLHIHNGSGQPFRLTARQPLDLKPGDQLTVRVRIRKATLLEHVSLAVPGVGSFAPQVYRQFKTSEYTWLVPPSATGPFVLQLIGAGGGDTYLSRLEAFKPEPPLSPFVTGRFLPQRDLHREGRLFEIEKYVVNREALSTQSDRDGDRLWSVVRLSREENTPCFSRGTALKSDSVLADREKPEDGCPPLHVRVGPLEPGRYQVHMSVPGRALAYSADGRKWTRLPGTTAPALGLMTLTRPFFDFWLDDRYAEPGNPGPTYVDFIRFMPIEDPAYTMAPAKAPVPLAHSTVQRRRVRLTIANPGPSARGREPVRSGVPIPQGELADADQVRLVDPDGREVPCFARITGRWPDGSVKWLLLDLEAAVPPHSVTRLTLEYGSAVRRVQTASPFSIEQAGTKLTVDTGAGRIVFDGQRGGQFALFLPDHTEPALSLEEAEFAAVDGRLWRSSLEHEAQVEVEEQTPLRVVVRLRGRCADADGPGPLAFDTRVHLFADRPDILVEYGFFATEQEPTIPLQSARLRFRGPWAGSTAHFGLSESETKPVPVEQAPRLLQTGDNAYGNSGRFPFKLTNHAGKTLAQGQRAPGWLRLTGPLPALFCVPHFWEQFPKALSCESQTVSFDLWPADEGLKPFIAHAGAGKSHRLGISLESDATPERWLAPLFAAADPEWYCASGAFEELVPRRTGRYQPYEAIVDAAFETLLKDRAGYGMENWGDVWQGGYVRGAKTWSNQEWDLVNNWVIPFVRTGNQRFLDFAHEAARHYADVDCIHYSSNPALVGGAWMHAHTSLRGHQLEPPNFPHAGWVEGMLNIYHLTGDRRGLEAAQGIAQYICRHAPQADHLPARGPAYNLMIQRPAGWPLTTLCLVYRDTWEPVYLQTARRIVDYARRCQDPERGVWDAQVGHEIPYRGGCVFAYTLFRGLRLFADLTGEARARQDYARAARWVFGEMWRPGHRYLYEQCPLHEPGARVPFILSEMGGYATRLSGNPIYATIAYEAFREHTASGAQSWMVGRAAAAQWGNGILQQVPRMLWDWEHTGLSVDQSVELAPAREITRLPLDRPGRVRFVLRNDSQQAMAKLTASCLIRGDWKARVVSCPESLAPGAEAAVELECQAPPPIEQYELQNDLAHVHVLVQYRHGEQAFAAWGYARLQIAKPLEITAPASVALKPGATTVLRAAAVDGVDAHPQLEVTAQAKLPGLTAGEPRVEPTGEGAATIAVTLSGAADAKPATGDLTLAVRSGPRSTTAIIPAEIGRFRVALIESESSAEWRYPFEALRRYPGIAIEFIPAGRVRQLLPSSAAQIAARWEVIILAETSSGAEAFAPEQLQALADFVRAGGGLMTIGGMKCYTPGGYAATPLKDVLPVDLSDGSYVMGQIGVEVLEKQLRLFEGYDPAFPDFGAHQMLKAKPGARVIARFTDGTPFVALQEAGKGRTLALGAIWNHGSGRAFRQWAQYGRFIGRCVRWLGRDLELEPD